MSEQKNMVTEEQKFVENVIERIQEQMLKKGFCIKYYEKLDNNIIKHGIEIFKEEMDPGFRIGAIVYYDKTWLNASDEIIIQKILNAVKQTPDINVEQLMDKKYILQNVKPMIQKIENLDRIQETEVFYTIHDCFVILYYISIQGIKDNFSAHTKIQKNILKSLHIEEEELVNCAFKNIEKELFIQSMHEVMEEMLGHEISIEEESPLIVISNREKCFGASAILLPEVYKQLSKKLGEKFIILPSSINECLAIEYQDDLEMLVDMVKEVNASQVEPAEQLSDHIYLCSKEGVSLLK